MTNTFSENGKKQVPKSFEDCCKIGPLAENLWAWRDSIETWGKYFFYFLLIAGGIYTLASSIIFDTYPFSDKLFFDEFRFGTFIASLALTAICSFVEYATYHILALLIASRAAIVQNTRVAANIALYNTAKAEGLLPEETEQTAN